MRLLDFLADHVDFDYTLTLMHHFSGVSRPTLYPLVDALESERILVRTREVGGSRFYRLNTTNPKVVAMLQMDFRQTNEELSAGGFQGVVPKGRPTPGSPRRRRSRASA